MSAPKTPIIRLTLRAEKYPSALGTDVLYSSIEDQSDAIFSEGRIITVGPLERSISDPSGEHFLAQTIIRHADTDHFWRERGAADSTRFLEGRDAILEIVSRDQLDISGPRTVLMRAKARGVDLEDGLGAAIALEELIGSEFGPSFLDKLINPRKFRRAFAPNITRPLLDQHIPIIIGEVSDVGSTGTDGSDAAKGLCPGFDLGDFQVSSTGSTPGIGPLLPTPPAPTFEIFGAGGTTIYTYYVSVRTAVGRTDLSPGCEVTGAAALSVLSPTNGVRLFLAQYISALQAQVTGIDLYVKQGGLTSTSRKYFVDAAGQMFNTAVNVPFTGTVGYEDNGDDSHFKGFNPPPTTNTAGITGSITTDGTTTTVTTYGLIAFADSACSELLALYGSSGGEEEDPIRELWTLGDMDDVLDPSSGGWPHANPWIDLVGTDGITERIFGIYVRGPRLDHHRTGRVTIAANICGRPEDANDASTECIDQAFRMWQHIISQVFSPDGAYYTGAWAGLPLHADGVEAISSPSVQAAEALSALLLGTAKGFLTGFCLTKPMSLREFIRSFNRQYCSFSYLNEDGALSIAMVNTLADSSTGTPVREDIDEVVVMAAPREKREWTETRVSGHFDWDADAGRWRSDPVVLNSIDGQTAIGVSGRLIVRDRGEVEGLFIRDPITFNAALGQRLLLFQRAPRQLDVRMGTSGFNIKVMEQVLVSGHEGYGSNGYDLQPMLVIGRVDFPDGPTAKAKTMLRLWDMGEVLPTAFGEIVDDVHVWGDGEEVWGDGERRWG